MKFFSILVFVSCFLSKAALAERVEVPGPGSAWEGTSIYTRTADDGSPLRKEIETFRVDRMEGGRPVFAGRMLGFDGEIIQSSEGTIVYALECKNDVPADMLLPPVSPNQCVGHVCTAPSVGDNPLVRATFIYVPIFGCQGQEGEYTFTPIRVEEYGGRMVTVGDAKFTLKGNLRAAWKSYIQPGVGQVFAEFLEKVTTYKVNVLLVPYEAGRIETSTSAARTPQE